MRSAWFAVFLLLIVPVCSQAQKTRSQQGTVVRMRMAECLTPSHPLMAALSGAAAPADNELCPEYTLISDKVIYLVVGKSSGQLVPLAENIRFRLHKNELLVRVDDENHEGRFLIRAMMLRSEWEQVHARLTEEESDAARRRLDDVIAGGELH
jgi:hypothetical protein